MRHVRKQRETCARTSGSGDMLLEVAMLDVLAQNEYFSTAYACAEKQDEVGVPEMGKHRDLIQQVLARNACLGGVQRIVSLLDCILAMQCLCCTLQSTPSREINYAACAASKFTPERDPVPGNIPRLQLSQ